MFEEVNRTPPEPIESVAEASPPSSTPDSTQQPLLPGLSAFIPPVEKATPEPEPEPTPIDAPVLLSEQPLPEEETEESAELADWKNALRHDFEQWLSTIDQLPEPPVEDAPEIPDLCSFYEQLALSNVETRKSNRRAAEAFSQWAETLAQFEAQLGPLRESTANLAAAQPKQNELPRAYCLALVEFLDRMYRLTKAFDSTPPRKSWWSGNDAAWRRAWETQRQGLAILAAHFEELLRKEEITRLDVLGQPFDPTVMTAVAVEPAPDRPNQIVLEELAPGYRRRGELLRAAQVKVSARP